MLGIGEVFMNGGNYWKGLKKRINDINDYLSNVMTEDILGQIKANSRPKEVPIDELTDEEKSSGVSRRFWKLDIIFDGTYSGSKNFSSQGRVSDQRVSLRSFEVNLPETLVSMLVSLQWFGSRAYIYHKY